MCNVYAPRVYADVDSPQPVKLTETNPANLKPCYCSEYVSTFPFISESNASVLFRKYSDNSVNLAKFVSLVAESPVMSQALCGSWAEVIIIKQNYGVI